LTQKVTFFTREFDTTEASTEGARVKMRRIVKRTVTVTSIETWTISFENHLPIEPLQAEETPTLVTDAIEAIGDDRSPQQHVEREAEDGKSFDVTRSTAEEKQD